MYSVELGIPLEWNGAKQGEKKCSTHLLDKDGNKKA